MRMQLTIACVLKSGGDYDLDYVERLAAMVRRQTPHINYCFVCLTDLRRPTLPGVIFVPLKHDLPGWWSKMELFKLLGPVVTFDLDVVILSRFDSLIDAILALPPDRMLMLRGWRDSQWSSCIMGWRGNTHWILKEFLSEVKIGKFEKKDKMLSFVTAKESCWGDQLWIEKRICRNGNEPVSAQNNQPGIYSYKWHVRKRNRQLPPDNATIICFHGSPRPREVAELSWMRRHWTK